MTTKAVKNEKPFKTKWINQLSNQNIKRFKKNKSMIRACNFYIVSNQMLYSKKQK